MATEEGAGGGGEGDATTLLYSKRIPNQGGLGKSCFTTSHVENCALAGDILGKVGASTADQQDQPRCISWTIATKEPSQNLNCPKRVFRTIAIDEGSEW